MKQRLCGYCRKPVLIIREHGVKHTRAIHEDDPLPDGAVSVKDLTSERTEQRAVQRLSAECEQQHGIQTSEA